MVLPSYQVLEASMLDQVAYMKLLVPYFLAIYWQILFISGSQNYQLLKVLIRQLINHRLCFRYTERLVKDVKEPF